jgi:hypothetical protein
MNKPELSTNGGASPDERDSVRCDAWLDDETALRKLADDAAGEWQATRNWSELRISERDRVIYYVGFLAALHLLAAKSPSK